MRDFCVIGGGIIGLSVAYHLLLKFPGSDIVVLEKEDRVGKHQTGHNSGVIHSGIYYPPGSLKAKLCMAGAVQIKEFCEENDIPFEETGKYLVATNDQELERMRAIAERAKIHEIPFETIDGAELASREPSISGKGALFVPSTGITDYTKICSILARLIQSLGGEIRYSADVRKISEFSTHIQIATHADELAAKQLVTCGGLQSDRLVKLSGQTPNFKIIPFRGEYYRLPDNKNDAITSLIYPIPDPNLPFLGIHLTKMIDGSITVGPNAVLGFAREKYARGSVSLNDCADFMSYSGFWRMLGGNIRPALTEFRNSVFKSGYLAACRKYMPELTKDELFPCETGIRAQAVMRDGSFAHDFLFQQTDRILHVCNAPSPAATSSLPIGQFIVGKVECQLNALKS